MKLAADAADFRGRHGRGFWRERGGLERDFAFGVGKCLAEAGDKAVFVERNVFHERRAGLICSARSRTACFPSEERLAAEPLVKRVRR